MGFDDAERQMVSFRVFSKILSDPDFQSLSLADIGRWVMLAVLTAQQGVNGVLTLPQTAETILSLFRCKTWLALREMILRIPNVTVEDDLASKSFVITWKNWSKYQTQACNVISQSLTTRTGNKPKNKRILKPKEESLTTEPTEAAIEPEKTSLLKHQALEVLTFLNQKTGRQYRPVAVNVGFIVARLKEGATVENCKGVIVRKAREWKNKPDMLMYLRPATLFNQTKFEQYLGEREHD